MMSLTTALTWQAVNASVTSFLAPYLCDLLLDVLCAVLHLGGAEQLYPGGRRRAALRAPAGWTPTYLKV